MSSVREGFSQYLVSRAACGLKNPTWDIQAKAFLGWCWRKDTLSEFENIKKCDRCNHMIHRPLACGQPQRGKGYPYYQVCLCCAAEPTISSDTVTIDRTKLEQMWEWINKAENLLNQVKTKQLAEKIKNLPRRP